MHDLLEPILKHPDAPSILERLQVRMQDEAEKRRSFREWIDDSQKAEFINGEVIMHSPVKKRHWNASSLLSRILSIYADFNDLGTVGVEKVMIGLSRNDYEPDICFFSKEKSKAFHDDQMIFPAPDFVVEILSKRTAKTDKTIKKQDYALHGIKEYWIIDPIKQSIEQYHLLLENDKEYFPAFQYNIYDEIESKVIAGFKIPVIAIFDTDENMKVMKQLLKK